MAAPADAQEVAKHLAMVDVMERVTEAVKLVATSTAKGIVSTIMHTAALADVIVYAMEAVLAAVDNNVAEVALMVHIKVTDNIPTKVGMCGHSHFPTFQKQMTMIKRHILVCYFMLCVMGIKAQDCGRLLYESIYSYTGKGWQDDGTVMQTYNQSAFYAKIYENCLVETSGDPLPKDCYYTYLGNNKQNKRIYQYYTFYFLVDQNYNLTRVIQTYDFRFGTNVKKYLYSEIKKGDLPKQTPQEILQEYKNQIDMLDMYRF